MFLNRVCRMFSNLFGYLFHIRNCKRITYPYTDEEFATAMQACPVNFNRPIKEGSSRLHYGPPDCPAILPKGYRSESDGYAFLVICQNCGKFDDHLTRECKIKTCDSEYFKKRFPSIPPPKGSPFERNL